MESCPACGAEVTADSLYCRQCGRPLRICPSCGRELPREVFIEARYCPNCGQALVRPQAALPTVKGGIGWGIGDVLKVSVFAFLLDIPLILILLLSLSPLAGIIGMQLPLFAILSSFHLLLLAFTSYYIRKRGGSWKDLGISSINPRLFAMGASLGIALLTLSAVIGFLTTPITGSSPIQDETLNLVNTPGMFPVIFSFAAIIAPIIEEIYFRGFSYQAFRRRWGTNAGILGSAAFFALLHLDPWVFLDIFAVGIALAYAYEKTRSLSVVIIAHILNNALALLISF